MIDSTAPKRLERTPTELPSPESTERNPPGAESTGGALLEHEYDGIREYDNPMPRWWVATFWATFVFSIGYLFHFHVTGKGQNVEEAYAQAMREQRADEARRALGETVTEASLAALMGDIAMMTDARRIFEDRCAACHADRGQGAIGPNLTDDHWLHGDGSLLAIYRLISDGVPEKGMPPWNRQLDPVELRQLAAFVGTLRGTSLPGKPPEGQKLGAAPRAPIIRHASTHGP